RRVEESSKRASTAHKRGVEDQRMIIPEKGASESGSIRREDQHREPEVENPSARRAGTTHESSYKSEGAGALQAWTLRPSPRWSIARPSAAHRSLGSSARLPRRCLGRCPRR